MVVGLDRAALSCRALAPARSAVSNAPKPVHEGTTKLKKRLLMQSRAD